MSRPPSSSPLAPDWPRADHRLQPYPATVPCATSVALAVSAGEGPPDVAGFVCGEQSEFATGTTAASVRAAAGGGLLLAKMPANVPPAASTATAVASPSALRRRIRAGRRGAAASASAAISSGAPTCSRISRTESPDSSLRASVTCSRRSSSSWLRRLLGSGARARRSRAK